jgi:hypothetical protein
MNDKLFSSLLISDSQQKMLRIKQSGYRCKSTFTFLGQGNLVFATADVVSL